MSRISSLQGLLPSGTGLAKTAAVGAAGIYLTYLAGKKIASVALNSPALCSGGVALVGKLSACVLPASKHEELVAFMQAGIPQGSTIASVHSAAKNFLDAQALLVAQIEQMKTPTHSEPIATTPPDDNKDLIPLIEQEKNRFVKNMTNFLLLKNLYEKTIGKAEDDQFYNKILYAAKTEPNPDSHIKESFFKLLKDAKVNIFRRFFVRIQWILFSKVINYAIKNAYDSHIKEVFQYTDKNRATDFSDLKNLFRKNIGRTLTIMDSMYDTISSKPATDTIPAMLDQEMEKPENNLGTSAKQLYSKFIKIELTKSLGWFLAFLAKPFLSGDIVHNLVNTSSSSILNTDGYAHALNTVLVDELQKVFKLLQANKTNGEELTLTNSLSSQKKYELTVLLKTLLEILPKSQASTAEEIQRLLNNSSWASQAYEFASPHFIDPIIEEAVKLIQVISESFNENRSLKVVLNLAMLANRNFDPDIIPPREAYQEKEKELQHVTDQIITLAINDVIDNRLDLSGDAKKKLINKTIETLRTETTEYTQYLETEINALTESNPNDQDEQTLLTDRTKLEALKKQTASYKQKSCLDVLRDVKASNQLDDEHRAALEGHLLKVGVISQPLVEALDAAWKISDTIEQQRISRPLLQTIQSAIKSISQTSGLNLPRLQYIDDCKASLIEIGTMLEILQKQESNLVPTITDNLNILSNYIICYDNINSLIVFQREQYKTANLIDTLVQQKKDFLKEKKPFFHFFGARKTDSHSEETITTLSDRIQSLPHTDLKITLTRILDHFRNCKSEEAIDILKISYLNVLNTEINSQAAKIEAIKTNIENQCALIEQSIANFELISNPNVICEKRIQIQTLLKKANTPLEAIKSWNTHDLTDFNYKWEYLYNLALWVGRKIVPKDTLKAFLFNQIKTRVEGLKHFIQQPTTLKFALHHLVLLPYVEWSESKDK